MLDFYAGKRSLKDSLPQQLGVLTLACAFFLAASSCSSAEPTTGPTLPPNDGVPSLDITASLTPTELHVGETVAVSTDAGGSGIPQYTLSVGEATLAVTRYDGILVLDSPNDRFELVSWMSGANEAIWTIRALEAGEFEVRVFVSGEVGVIPTGPFFFRSDTETFQLTVLPSG